MAQWPTALSTDATLYIAVNSLQTTLNGTITNSVTTILLQSTTGFPTAGVVTIDSEVIFYTGISGANLTGCSRGSDGTTAASHNSGVPVGATIVAFHHNNVKDEIKALEADLSTRIGFANANNQVLALAGGAAAPSYSFVADTDTGAWLANADQYAIGTNGVDNALFTPTSIAFSTSGSTALYIDTNGFVGIGVGATTSGYSSLTLGSGIVINQNGNDSSVNFDTNGIHLEMTHAKNQASSGGEGSLKILSNDPHASVFQGTIALVTDPTAANRHLEIECIEQGTAFRPVVLNLPGGPVGIGIIPSVGSGLPIFQIKQTSNIDLTVGLGIVNTSALGISAVNDAVTALISMELRASDFIFSGPTNPVYLNSSGTFRLPILTASSVVATDASDNLVSLSSGSAGQVLTSNGSSIPSFNTPVDTGFIHIVDQKTAGTDGGTATSGSWQTRTLNTTLVDTNSNVVSLSSNQITLVAGTYEVFAQAPFYTVGRAILRLQNTTDSVTIVEGTAGFSTSTQQSEFLYGKFTIAASKALALQYQCQVTVATNGLGLDINATFTVPYETYAQITFRRVA